MSHLQAGGGARLKRKALSLLADLVAADAGAHQGAGLGLDYPAAVAAVLQLLEAEGRAPQAQRDQDLQVGQTPWVGESSACTNLGGRGVGSPPPAQRL